MNKPYAALQALIAEHGEVTAINLLAGLLSNDSAAQALLDATNLYV